MFVYTAQKGSDLSHKGPSMLLRQRATSFLRENGGRSSRRGKEGWRKGAGLPLFWRDQLPD